ncbi:Sjogren's syndrome/scleroderma autoantigen 1 family protein [Halorientalis litorea]|uniref:Sjogren's syndrome/scleroderma autoantigen 1 family protein n=1 Tax=Halorientalis litorea TaxID=2931977 RepID=UPI001FF3C4D7|nr:Sjogren's syndrome/scleroderma autoantigen 1 family protein [Halorientalis litorea]
MSDFDKEAEREKLREKYENDRTDRESTERMSDLLLKGATMTNAHCGTCGDPIFRHEGQEFCPTCQTVLREDGEPVEGDAEDAAADETDPTDASAGADRQPPTPNGTDPAETRQSGVAADRSAPETGGRSEQSAPSTTPGTTPPGTQASHSGGTPTRGHTPDESARQPQTRGDTGATQTPPATTKPGDGTGTHTLDAARASLTRTVNRLAARAEESEDPERVRAYLTATEAAADALAAVNDAER